MIRKGQLPEGNPDWVEVPYMDEKGWCWHCHVTHRPNSAIGRDHSTAVAWTNKNPMPRLSDVLRDILGEK